MKQKQTPNPHGREGKPISLAPYSFEDALKKILKAEPPRKEAKKKKPAKSRTEPSKNS
jgi:hypothetical protein